MLRALSILILATGLAIAGGVVWVQTRPAARPEPPAPVVEQASILVAARPLRVGALLKPEDLAARQVPLAEIPANAMRDSPALRAELTGAIVRRSLAASETIARTDVLRPSDHGFLAAVLGAGMRAATVAVDAVSGSAGLIWPGDRVDLLLTQNLDREQSPGRRVAGETVLRDVRVIAIDQTLEQGADGGPATGTRQARTVTLEVTPRQAEQVAVATRLGRLSLVVRAATPADREDERDDNAAPTVTWASDVSPALRGTATTETGGPVTMRVFSGAGRSEEYRF